MKKYVLFLILSIALATLSAYGKLSGKEPLQFTIYCTTCLASAVFSIKARRFQRTRKLIFTLLGVSLIWCIIAYAINDLRYYVFHIQLAYDPISQISYTLSSVGLCVSLFFLYFDMTKKENGLQLKINELYSFLLVSSIILLLGFNVYSSRVYTNTQFIHGILFSCVAGLSVAMCLTLFLSSGVNNNIETSALLMGYTLFSVGDLFYIINFITADNTLYGAIGTFLTVLAFCLFFAAAYNIYNNKSTRYYQIYYSKMQLEIIFVISFLILIIPFSLYYFEIIEIAYVIVISIMSVAYQLLSFFISKSVLTKQLAHEQKRIQAELDWEISNRLSNLNDIHEKLTIQVTTDSLTSLKNRNYLNSFLDNPPADLENIYLVYLDIDKFKPINDTYGHTIGDEVIKSCASRIQKICPPDTLCFRVGGDEFVIATSNSSRNKIMDLSQLLIYEIKEPLKIGKHTFALSASIGISSYPDDAGNVKAILKNAEQAMYSSKSDKIGGRITFYDEVNDNYSQKINMLEFIINNCLPDEQLAVLYRPIYSIDKKRIVGFDAKIDWGKLTDYSDEADILSILEKSQKLYDIIIWLVDEVEKQLFLWRKTYSLSFCCHICPPLQTFSFTDIESKLYQSLKENNLSNGSIIIDLDEKSVENLFENNNNILLKLSYLNIPVCLTNFGTGYTAFYNLKKYKFDYIKINKNFANNIDYDNKDSKIYSAIVQIAKTFSQKVISTGINTNLQAHLALGFGVDEFEGLVLNDFAPAEFFEKRFSSGYYDELNWR